MANRNLSMTGNSPEIITTPPEGSVPPAPSPPTGGTAPPTTQPERAQGSVPAQK